MTVNFPGGVNTNPTALGGRKVEVPAVKNTNENQQQEPKTTGVDNIDLNVTEQRRAEAVQRAAESFFNDFFAVSDTTFSIYKDTSGQYITRFTSLRDGRVTYIPEPDLLAHMERARQARESIVKLEA